MRTFIPFWGVSIGATVEIVFAAQVADQAVRLAGKLCHAQQL
ncbi:hypothetical protein OB2597_06765 [Pseudooceanicola batsensis HTCC2597]|uniref:Uncharacterized protein n=1 Tax=Pseudooceanicola batsensis (strain ATCC BAA-863 / DSM 15984 / KCTC 12145 / HTCC2597) TaxID=252305 RepID=A3TTI8_PSEBH|nr:hypothetical protein OB2597_06765 [Pseudooceanicola batsensis HTCC2597]